MACKFIILGMALALLSGSCKAPAYLPETEEIGSHEFGSYISIEVPDEGAIEGELIAINDEAFMVLDKEGDHQLQSIPIADIKSFKLLYAQPENYGWTIPVSVLVTASHGIFAVFTAPVNIIVTSVVTARGRNAFTYNDGDISTEDLKMFARFPQGIPPGIETANLK